VACDEIRPAAAGREGVKLAIGAIAVTVMLALVPALPAWAEQPSRPVVVKVDSGGFHWVDALIGAGALAGLALGVSGAFSLYFRRDRRVETATKEER
jgi:hypothetical protein